MDLDQHLRNEYRALGHSRRRSCHCAGCSWLGWIIVRLPDPLYRIARHLL